MSAEHYSRGAERQTPDLDLVRIDGCGAEWLVRTNAIRPRLLPATVRLLRPAADALKTANELLQEATASMNKTLGSWRETLSIEVLAGYRTPEDQQRLSVFLDECRKPHSWLQIYKLSENPQVLSSAIYEGRLCYLHPQAHTTGREVDIALVNGLSGTFFSPNYCYGVFADYGRRIGISYDGRVGPQVTEVQEEAASWLLNQIMQTAGFQPSHSREWHFTYCGDGYTVTSEEQRYRELEWDELD